MTELDLGVRQTPARRHFKSKAGQNNHFLVTVLVGLDSVLDETTQVAPDFSTSWTPQNRTNSYHRSRQYVLESSLVWILDLVDGYRMSLGKTEGLLSVTSVVRMNQLDGRSRKLRELARLLHREADNAENLVRAAYSWRNRVVHGETSNRVSPELRSLLLPARDEISEEYRGLDIERFLSSADGSEIPTFKETASTIAAAHKLIEQLDDAAIDLMDLEQYAESILRQFFVSQFDAGNRAIFVQYWPGDEYKTRKRLRQFLLQSGFVANPPSARTLSSEWAHTLTSMTAREARSRFIANTHAP